MLKKACRILFLLFLINASASAAIIRDNPFPTLDPVGLSPFWDWKTIDTDHFRVSFPKDLGEIAVRTTHLLEETHKALSPVFKWEPHERVQVLLIDNRDSPNGLAAALARIGIVLWVTPPENIHDDAYYEDWLRMLVIHEYVHFLNLDTQEGLWKITKILFGYTGLPNSTWAPWMLEGLAVYMETLYTTGGRGRSPYYDMVLRAATEEGVLDQTSFITLDKVNGPNPYFPRGDTRYQFGYHLMNTVGGKLGAETLGDLSKYSSSGIPFDIENNLQDVAGQDWSDTWNEWIVKTRERVDKDLQTIRQAPISKLTWLTEKKHETSNEISGIAASPDGKWLAFNIVSSDRRYGIDLYEISTGMRTRIVDKVGGAQLQFTADSSALIYSGLRPQGLFHQYSDLAIYDLKKGTYDWLSDGLRARDPSISPDGRWVTFTLTEPGVTGLAVAELKKADDKYRLGEVQKLFMSSRYDHVGMPRFSKDGARVFFSFHANGKTSSDLLAIRLADRHLETWVADGFFNRYPSVDKNGVLYFVSNRTGVENLYRYRENGKHELVTNLTTGISFSTWGIDHQLYGSVFSTSGWDLARIQPLETRVDPEKIRISRPPAPEFKPVSPLKEAPLEIKDYSAFPSILPRVWLPLIDISTAGVAVGGQLWGFDAIDRHRYTVAAQYDFPLGYWDGFALYSNRSLGATLDLYANVATGIQSVSQVKYYDRDISLSLDASYSFLWVYTSLTPAIGLNIERNYYYNLNTGFSSPTAFVSPIVPSIDVSLGFQNLEYSALGVAPEGGRATQIASRVYLRENESNWKLLIQDQEFIRLSPHTVLIPSIKALWSSTQSQSFPSANATVQGRSSRQVIDTFPSDSLSRITIRGYPGQAFSTRAAAVTAIDLRFPIGRIFRGLGTFPAFLENLYGLAFLEGAKVDFSSGNFLGSAGTGLRLSGELLYLPFVASAEYHQGFDQNFGGASDFFFQLFARFSL